MSPMMGNCEGEERTTKQGIVILHQQGSYFLPNQRGRERVRVRVRVSVAECLRYPVPLFNWRFIMPLMSNTEGNCEKLHFPWHCILFFKVALKKKRTEFINYLQFLYYFPTGLKRADQKISAISIKWSSNVPLKVYSFYKLFSSTDKKF